MPRLAADRTFIRRLRSRLFVADAESPGSLPTGGGSLLWMAAALVLLVVALGSVLMLVRGG